jgi:hypothetical protein
MQTIKLSMSNPGEILDLSSSHWTIWLTISPIFAVRQSMVITGTAPGLTVVMQGISKVLLLFFILFTSINGI